MPEWVTTIHLITFSCAFSRACIYLFFWWLIQEKELQLGVNFCSFFKRSITGVPISTSVTKLSNRTRTKQNQQKTTKKRQKTQQIKRQKKGKKRQNNDQKKEQKKTKKTCLALLCSNTHSQVGRVKEHITEACTYVASTFFCQNRGKIQAAVSSTSCLFDNQSLC